MPAKSRVELQKLHFVQRERFKRCPDRLDAPYREIVILATNHLKKADVVAG